MERLPRASIAFHAKWMGSGLPRVLKALRGPGARFADLDLPESPGLYAVYGSAQTWKTLGLGDPPDERPLYVGKSESSLVSRDIGTHFTDGRTGSSTLRRSIAALLAAELGFEAQPRNPRKPERFANYGLRVEDERELTKWMKQNLRLSAWTPPETVVLGLIEREILAALLPPLNIKDVSTPWTALVSGGRARMAAQAREWAEEAKPDVLRRT